MTTARARIGALVAALALVAGAAPAHADAASFTLTPSATQAGASPDLTLTLGFGGGNVRNATIALAPGLLANPRVAAPCAASDLQADRCPAASRVGGGFVTASVFFFGVNSPMDAYLVQPSGGEIARLGLVIHTPLGTIVRDAPVQLRTTGGVSLLIPFTDLPRNVGIIPIHIDAISLTLAGGVNGLSFTRMPTSCGPATSSLTTADWDTGAIAGASSTMTPTGCDRLGYAPTLSASAALGRTDDGVALTTSIVQRAADAASRRIAVTLPLGVIVRPSTLARACGAADPASCPDGATVGSVSVTTPLLADPVGGRVVLATRPNGLPGLTLLLGAPLSLRLDASTTITPTAQITATFDGLPDVPLTRLDLALSGGPTSLLANERELCLGGATVVGDFLGHSGAAGRVTAPVAVSGCPGIVASAAPVATAAGGTDGTSGSGSGAGGGVGALPSGRPLATVSVAGLHAHPMRVSALVRAPAGAAGLRRVLLCLPGGMRLARSRVRGDAVFVVANGKRVFAPAVGVGRQCVRVDRPSPGARSVSVAFNAPALTLSPRLRRLLRHGRRLTFSVEAIDATGTHTVLSPAARGRLG